VPFSPGTSSLLDASRFLPALPALAAGTALFLWLLHRVWLRRLSPPPGTLALGWPRQLAIGAGGALLLVLVSVLLPALAGRYRSGAPGWLPFVPPPGEGAPAGAFRLAGEFLLQSLSEELLFRGVVMGGLGALLLFVLSFVTVHPMPGEPPDSARLAAARRRTWLLAGLLANAAQAALFTAVHAGNPGVTTLASWNIGLAGLVLGWLYWSQGSLLGAWGWHFAWNFGLAAAGLPVSGVLSAPPLLPLGISGARPGLLSGGAFGPEGSLLCTAAFLGFLLLLARPSGRPDGEDGP